MVVVKCDSCGGCVASRSGQPACMFCGNAVDVVTDAEETTEPSEGWLPFQVAQSGATEAFRTFAGSSLWYPSAIRGASVELRQLMLPAWSWRGELESHWTGLVSDFTKSGKRPVAGMEVGHFDQVMVPSSATLTVAELTGLGRYDESSLVSMDSMTDVPTEVSELTRSAAQAAAVEEMERRHTEQITASQSLTRCNLAAIPSSLQGRAVLVPVWVGVYQHKELSYRVLVNGQTGAFVGEAPTDWVKVVGVVLAALLGIAALIGLVASLFS